MHWDPCVETWIVNFERNNWCLKKTMLKESGWGGWAGEQGFTGARGSRTRGTTGRVGYRTTRNAPSFFPQPCVHCHLMPVLLYVMGTEWWKSLHLIRRAWRYAVKPFGADTPKENTQLPESALAYSEAGDKQQANFWRLEHVLGVLT